MADNSEDHVLEKLKTVIEEVLKVDASKISPESNFRTDLGADSIDLMTLVVSLEEEFDGKISDEEVTNIATVADALNLIQHEIIESD